MTPDDITELCAHMDATDPARWRKPEGHPATLNARAFFKYRGFFCHRANVKR